MPDRDDPSTPLVNIKPLLENALNAFEVENTTDVIAPTLTPEQKQAKMQELQQKMAMAQQVATAGVSPPGAPQPQLGGNGGGPPGQGMPGMPAMPGAGQGV